MWRESSPLPHGSATGLADLISWGKTQFGDVLFSLWLKVKSNGAGPKEEPVYIFHCPSLAGSQSLDTGVEVMYCEFVKATTIETNS